MSFPRWARRWSIGTLAFFAGYTVAGFWVLPPLARVQLEKRLTAQLGRSVTIGGVRANPYSLSLTFVDFNVREKDAVASFVAWKRLHVNFDALASLGGDWVLSNIELDGFHAAVAIHADRSFNFSDLLTKFPAAPASTKPARPIRIERLAVTASQVDFSDRSRRQPFKSTVGPLTFTLSNFRSADGDGAPYHFEAVTETREKLAWSGTLAANPPSSAGQFDLSDFALTKYTPFFEEYYGADLGGGTLSVRGRYELRFAAGGVAVKLHDGAVTLRDLRLDERGTTRRAVEITLLELRGVEADMATSHATIASAALSGGRVAVRREKDGSLNLLSLLKPSGSPIGVVVSSSASTGAAATPTPPAALEVREVALKDFAVEITDDAASSAVQMALSSLQLSLKDFSLAGTTPMPINLEFTCGPSGRITVGGVVTLQPELSAELKTEVRGLELAPLSPYLASFTQAWIAEGVMSTTHTMRVALRSGQPAIEMTGDVQLDKLAIVSGVNRDELAGFASLNATALELATSPQLAVSAAAVEVHAPYGRIVVRADGSMNLAAFHSPVATEEKAIVSARPVTTTAVDSPTQIELGRMKFTDANFSFVDQSIEPNVRMSVTALAGTVAGLSSKKGARAELNLEGMVENVGALTIAGKIEPLGARKFFDVIVGAKDVDLLPFSPYAGKYAGYGITRGTLLIEAKILLDGSKIDARNVLTLHQFTLGPATNNPAATGLPVRLGVALLKDPEGVITLDLPVRGQLDDPNFGVGKVLLRVVTGLLTKAATSPFSMLGAMFGGDRGGEELAFQEFLPGSSTLQASELPKLATLIKALTKRPHLGLVLEGGYDMEVDSGALKADKFALLLQQRGQSRGAGQEISSSAVVSSPEEQAAIIALLFDERFPPGTALGVRLPPPPPVVAVPPVVSGFFRRIVHRITFQDRRDVRAAQRENERRTAEHQRALAATPPDELSGEEKRARLLAATTVDESDLQALGAARGATVREHLVTTGQIATERVTLAPRGAAPAANRGARVFLNLQ